MNTNEQREIERTRYWQEQALLSRDFSVQMDVQAHRRWWHNRSLHDAFGIAVGFDVRDRQADRAVWVGTVPSKEYGDSLPALTFDELNCATKKCPSVAYDYFGREIAVPCAQVVPYPASGNWHVLLVLAQPNEYKQISWQPIRSPTRTDPPTTIGDLCLNYRVGVPLALIDDSSTIREFAPPRARAMRRPRVASGATVAGKTDWQEQLFEVSAEFPADFRRRLSGIFGGQLSSLPFGFGIITTTIDLSPTGFVGNPMFFAWVEATSPFVSVFPPTVRHFSKTLYGIDLVYPVLVTGTSSSAFTAFKQVAILNRFARLFATRSRNEVSSNFVTYARRNLYIRWLAVSCHDECKCSTGVQ